MQMLGQPKPDHHQTRPISVEDGCDHACGASALARLPERAHYPEGASHPP